ncbi:unnamed protein product [Paramecium sonneborni]|uniref:60S ribosomal protein L35a n=1 Tax=Paramecium sonneborni TaxID=65129 RepID=A0A8S1LW49_9CILI|nr:unnamed protein product [Paramecium sonneborni]
MKGQAEQQKGATKTVQKVKTTNKSAPVRLWVKAVFTGFRRSKVQQNENQALLKIQHVNDVESSRFYWGKRVAYIYKAHSLKNNTKFRTIWGRISKSHGSNGVVTARFGRNLPPRAIGSTLRVFLYPNRA